MLEASTLWRATLQDILYQQTLKISARWYFHVTVTRSLFKPQHFVHPYVHFAQLWKVRTLRDGKCQGRGVEGGGEEQSYHIDPSELNEELSLHLSATHFPCHLTQVYSAFLRVQWTNDDCNSNALCYFCLLSFVIWVNVSGNENAARFVGQINKLHARQRI